MSDDPVADAGAGAGPVLGTTGPAPAGGGGSGQSPSADGAPGVGGAGDPAAAPGAAPAGVPAAPAAEAALCPATGCTVVLPDGVRSRRGYAHLGGAHVVGDLPPGVAAEYGLAGCRWCQRPFRSARGRATRSSLASHESRCAGNPHRFLPRAAAVAAPAAAPPPAAGAPPPVAGGVDSPFVGDHAAWVRARGDFLQRVAPAGAPWAPLIASGARTVAHVPGALVGAWRVLVADALDWVRRQPAHSGAWLWLLLLPSLLLHAPCRAPADAPDRPRPPLPHKARAATLMRGDFVAALADRNAGVWRPGWARPVPAGGEADRRGGGRAAAPTRAERRALKLVRAGRLSAAARALGSATPAPRTAAVWDKAVALFPPASSTSATPASVAADFSAALAGAADFGKRPIVPRAVPREAVVDAVRGAPKGSAPGPSGLRPEHLWALSAAGQDALLDVLLLLCGEAAVSRVPAAARHALAGADLLLLTKAGGVGADGLPRLRPIGMPEVLRKLAAVALARTVRAAAAELLAPAQLGVGVSSACERLLHEVEAHLALHPEHAVVQLDYRNAFNLVSRAAARAMLSRALPLLSPYLDWVYGGGEAPTVYGWAPDAGAGAEAPPSDVDSDVGDGAEAAPLPPPPPARLALQAERGAQQSDPLGPLLHAAALQLLLQRLRAAHPDVLIRAFHDDVVGVGAPADLHSVLAAAAAGGSAIDAELAPAKCVGWSPSGAAAPEGWAGEWAAQGITQFSVPLGGPAFVDAAVTRVAAEQGALVGAIGALPAEQLQSQLLLLRQCAGPRANYWLRALPLAAGARLAGAVDADARAVLGRLLFDARDSAATREAALERAALPTAMGGLGVGGRTRVAPAAALASWVDALRAGAAYSPALRAVADGLRTVPVAAADGAPVAGPAGSSALAGAAADAVGGGGAAAGGGGRAATGGGGGAAGDGGGGAGPPLAAGALVADAVGGGAPSAAPIARPGPAPRAVGAGNGAADASAPPSSLGSPGREGSASPPPPGSGVWFWGPGGVIQRPPPPSAADLDPAPPPLPPAPHPQAAVAEASAALALRRGLLELLDAQQAHAVAPASAGLWAPPPPDAAAPPRDADALALPLPYPLPPTCDAGATTATATGQHSPASHSPATWRALLGGEARATQRELSRAAHAAARARLYHELSLWRRAGMAACQGGGAALWLSALPTPGVEGTAIAGAPMRVAVRLWLGAPPRSVPPGGRCRCGRGADAEGRHFMSACLELAPLRARLHHHVVHLAVEALRAAPSWKDVVAEIALPASHGALRPDLRATHAASGVVVWADASITTPFYERAMPDAAVAPLRPVTAAAREAAKVAKYAPALVGRGTTHTFTPLVLESYGRIGPATRRWLRDALGGPLRAGARATLLRRVSVALWRSHSRAVAIGYSRCLGTAAVVEGEGEGGPLGPNSLGAHVVE